MKVLVICYEYPPIGGGGGRVAQGVAEQLVRRGHKMRVLTAALGWKSSRDTIGGVEIFRVGSGRRFPDTCTVPEMALYLATGFLPLMRQIRTWKPDVIHAHFAMPTGVLALAAQVLAGTPYVLTAHLGDVPGGVPEQTDGLFRIAGPLARKVWRGAAAATAVSSHVQKLAEAAYGVATRRILNGIDMDGAEPPVFHSYEPRKLVFLGRFNPQKNPSLLVRSLARMKEVPWSLVMIGDGPLMQELRSLIAEHRLGDRIVLRGWLSGEEVDRVLRESDVLCMPSLSEGMPVAAIEALRRGLAIVASDIPGMQDVVAEGVNGFLVSVNDVSGFESRLREVCSAADKLREMRLESWKKAAQFALPSIVAEYEKVLGSAIGRRQRNR